MKYILDTNTLIYFFKGIGKVADRLLNTPPRDIAIPAIVVYELFVGVEKSGSPHKRRDQLIAFTSSIQILPFDRNEAESASSIRVSLEKNGTPIGPYDVLIAATALSAGGILVTHNINEFRRISGLRIEDWF